MLKQLATLSIILVSCKTTSSSNSQSKAENGETSINKKYDFTEKRASISDFGLDFFYSDYPNGQVLDKKGLPAKSHEPGPGFYQLTQHYGEQGAFKGQVIGYSNRSDDVDTNIQIAIGKDRDERLKPNTTYNITAKLNFVTNSPEGATGAGGSPSATYFGLIATQTPWSAGYESITPQDIMAFLSDPEYAAAAEEISNMDDPDQMTKEQLIQLVQKHKIPVLLRTSTKSSDGKVTQLRNPHGDCSQDAKKNSWVCQRYTYLGQVTNGLKTDFTWKANSLSTKTPLQFKTDSSGNPVYINFVSHSGFEGVTLYYLTGVEVDMTEVK